jgi:ATP adenylyltransferase/5',5'''-P-1,P-4-tetraphosphate phosphorylase II
MISNSPATVDLGALIASQSMSIKVDEKQLYQSLLNYYNSGDTGGLYQIKRHIGNMLIPFSDKTSYSLYYSNGKHLETISGNAFLGL